MAMKDIFRKIAGMTEEEDDEITYDATQAEEEETKTIFNKNKNAKTTVSTAVSAKPKILPVKLNSFSSDEEMLEKVTGIADEFMND